MSKRTKLTPFKASLRMDSIADGIDKLLSWSPEWSPVRLQKKAASIRMNIKSEVAKLIQARQVYDDAVADYKERNDD